MLYSRVEQVTSHNLMHLCQSHVNHAICLGGGKPSEMIWAFNWFFSLWRGLPALGAKWKASNTQIHKALTLPPFSARQLGIASHLHACARKHLQQVALRPYCYQGCGKRLIVLSHQSLWWEMNPKILYFRALLSFSWRSICIDFLSSKQPWNGSRIIISIVQTRE